MYKSEKKDDYREALKLLSRESNVGKHLYIASPSQHGQHVSKPRRAWVHGYYCSCNKFAIISVSRLI